MFWSLEERCFKGAECCVLMYDVTNVDSFNSLDSHIDRFLKQASPKDLETFPFVLIGNKIDLEDKRQVCI